MIYIIVYVLKIICKSLRTFFAFLRLKPQVMFFFTYVFSNIARGFNHGKRIVRHCKFYFKTYNRCGLYVAFLRLKPQAMFFCKCFSNIARGFNHGKRILRQAIIYPLTHAILQIHQIHLLHFSLDDVVFDF
jgi:hypothetical protein